MSSSDLHTCGAHKPMQINTHTHEIDKSKTKAKHTHKHMPTPTTTPIPVQHCVSNCPQRSRLSMSVVEPCVNTIFLKSSVYF